MRTLLLHGCFLLLLVCLYDASNVDIDVKENPKQNLKKKDALPPCQACRMLANSFKKVGIIF